VGSVISEGHDDMNRDDKQRVVADLAERLRATDSLIVADYRGLTNAELAGVRTKLRDHGATFTVVKNTLTRRAAEEAGAESLLALLEGPTAIAFVESDGDAVAVAKALADTAKDTKILSLRGGILAGKPLEAADIEELAKLPPVDVLKSQLVGVIVAPLTQLVGLLTAPLRDLVGLIDARIEQLGGADAAQTATEPAAAVVESEPEAEAPAEEVTATDVDAEVEEAEVEAADEPAAAAEREPETGGADAQETQDGNPEQQEEEE
jgi:large subunit ribosomal protein L10